MSFQGAYQGKTVLLTGHTGFKGAWLAEWLLGLGARVAGFALDPPTVPSLFNQLALAPRLAEDTRADVRDLAALVATVRRVQPDVVFHLAAQPLVRLSYQDPAGTFATNVTGSVNVLEAIRREARRPCAVVMVTTDKCYENREWLHAYREEDALGGHDPYSASKAGAELVVAAYRRSFFAATLRGSGRGGEGGGVPVAVASARAGNVIGGGDWAAERIVPDCIRALRAGREIAVRNKTSTRPWQHVLEPLGGYLLLGQRMMVGLAALAGGDADADAGHGAADTVAARGDAAGAHADGGAFAARVNAPAANHGDAAALDAYADAAGALERLCGAFNFGPGLGSNRTVAALVEEVLRHWPGEWRDESDPRAPHEAGRLNLSIDKAFHLLGWSPAWAFEETVAATVEWYRRAETLGGEGGGDAGAGEAGASGTGEGTGKGDAGGYAELTRGQIAAYTRAAGGLAP